MRLFFTHTQHKQKGKINMSSQEPPQQVPTYIQANIHPEDEKDILGVCERMGLDQVPSQHISIIYCQYGTRNHQTIEYKEPKIAKVKGWIQFLSTQEQKTILSISIECDHLHERHAEELKQMDEKAKKSDINKNHQQFSSYDLQVYVPHLTISYNCLTVPTQTPQSLGFPASIRIVGETSVPFKV